MLVQFLHGTLAAYQQSAKSEGALFFTTDTFQLFKGANEITKSAKLVSTLPSIADGKYGTIYIVKSNLTPYVFDGASYSPLIKEYVTLFDSDATDETVPTSKAVVDYVNSVVSSNSEVRITTTLDSDDIQLTYDYLLDSGVEYYYTGGTVASISFGQLTESNDALSDDYWALFVFAKSTSVSIVEDLVLNSEIKLLNPDLDISGYSTVHLLFTYDGQNICCIAAGY